MQNPGPERGSSPISIALNAIAPLAAGALAPVELAVVFEACAEGGDFLHAPRSVPKANAD